MQHVDKIADGQVLVTTVVATLNEERHIEKTIRGLIDQDLLETVEILIVDGGSTDNTRRIAEDVAGELHRASRANRRLRVVDNPRQRTPYAFNIGIKEARGVYVAILGAHASYPANYLSECLDVVRSQAQAAAASGGIITAPGDGSRQARIVVASMTSPFGSSRKSFRTATAGEADTIPFPVIERRLLNAIGGYDERLLRNQDNDLSARLTDHGVKLLLAPGVQATYFAPRDLRAMVRYAWRNGWWNAKAFALGGKGMRIRHYAPGVMVAGGLVLAGAIVLGRPIERRASASLAVTGIAAHLVLGLRSLAKGRDRAPAALGILGLHLSYGTGTVASAIVHSGAIIGRLTRRFPRTNNPTS
jgi:succinoglycan biosynthesis protein ExoA